MDGRVGEVGERGGLWTVGGAGWVRWGSEDGVWTVGWVGEAGERGRCELGRSVR